MNKKIELKLLEALRELVYSNFRGLNEELYKNPNNRALKNEANLEMDFVTVLDKRILRLKNGD